MLNHLLTLPQYLVPQHGLARLMGKLTNCQQATLKNWAIRRFIAHYGVDMSEAQEPQPENYATFNDFFTRHLKPGARPIMGNPNQVISPVDGSISQIGQIQANHILQAKGHNYTVTELLGGNHALAAPFTHGRFATLYLSPKDYHRIHMPLTGQLQLMMYIPGKLFSVNPRTTTAVPRLFARNERVVCLFSTPLGTMAIILIGAFFVGSIHTHWAGKIAPAPHKKICTWSYGENAVTLQQGDELGFFQLGSSVIMLFESQQLDWDSSLHAGATIRLGQRFSE